MRILFVSKYYLPSKNAGGPVKSLKNLVDALEELISISILTEAKDIKCKQIYQNIVTNRWIYHIHTRIKYINKFTFKNAILSLVKNDYSIVYLNSLFAKSSYVYYPLILFLNDKQFIVAPRGELNKNALMQKQMKKKLFIFILQRIKIEKKLIFHATSPKEVEDIKYHFPNASCVMIPNLPSLNLDLNQRTEKKEGKLRIVLIARVSKMKNIKFAINTLSSVKRGEVLFDIYGPIEDKSYYEECNDVINKLPDNITVNFKGHIENDKIPSLLKKYDLFYSPTLGENYGHSIVEAIQHHIPVLISDNTPWLNLESKKVGKDISLDSPESFISYIDELIMLDNEEYLSKFTGFNDFIMDELNVTETKVKYLNLFRGDINE